MQISVLGAGSWGSALAVAMSNIAIVKLWSRNKEQVASIIQTRTNPDYLPITITFSDAIEATSDFAYALESDLVIIATPINALRLMITEIVKLRGADLPDIIWVCKGFEVSSGLLPHQIIEQISPCFKNMGALLGPSFAHEVASGLPTAITLASANLSFAVSWSEKLKGIQSFRIYANNDLIGSEVGAGVKNIMAIAVGICDGLELGYNARAGLITRSLNELGRLVLLLGGRSETIYGLTGIGDLILTCTGSLSRNRKVGLELAKGKQIADIVASLGHVAEGVNAAKEVYNLSKRLNIEMPIVNAVYKIIYEQSNLSEQVLTLLNRASKLEFEPK